MTVAAGRDVVVMVRGAGAPVQEAAGLDELRGFGVPAVKSAELLSVSEHPPPLRRAAVVLVSVGAGAVSEQLTPEP